MYKIVILDLDGTLLTSDKRISESNKKIINELSDHIKFVFASARAFTTIKPYIEEINLLNENNYTIAFNGSLIVNNKEEVIVDEYIGLKEKELLQDYINKNNNVEWHYYTYDKNILADNIEDINSFLKDNKIYKIVCISDEENIINMRNSMPSNIMDAFQITSSESTRIDFVKKGMSKTKAIQTLIETLNIESSEVIAMGDAENDMDMIMYAGCGVAMGNANDKVKSVADYITDTNDNDGVSKALLKLIKR